MDSTCSTRKNVKEQWTLLILLAVVLQRTLKNNGHALLKGLSKTDLYIS